MAQKYAANVTKYNAGGSGDNYIEDGYIKTVEKIWLDNYTLTSNVTATTATIDIAIIPDNKKITGIDVLIQTSASQTNGTVAIGNAGDSEAFMAETVVTHNTTMSVISIPGGSVIGSAVASAQVEPKMGGFQLVTDGTTGTIQLTLDAWTATTGTIKTKVRYT